MLRVNYHLTEHQIEELKNLSERTGLSMAELIRRAIDFYLKAQLDEDKKEVISD
jgi:predicted DNA-binding protein